MTLPRVGYVTAMWKRPDLTEIIFASIASLKKHLADRMELIPAVAGSEGESSRELAERHGFLYVEVPNSPLSDKWNASLALLRDRDVDGICIFGSDDLANATYFTCLLAELAHGRDLVGVDGMYFFDQLSGRLFDWKGYRTSRNREVPGAGRFVHRRYLDRLNWQLWPSGRESSLDGAMLARLKEVCGQGLEFFPLRHHEDGVVLLDIKSQTFMSSIESLAAAGPMDIVGNPYSFLQRHYGTELVQQLFLPQTPRLDEEDRPIVEVWENSPVSAAGERQSPGIFCISQPDKLGSLARDALFSLRSMGRNVYTLTPQEFFLCDVRPEDILYVQPLDCHFNEERLSLLCSCRRQAQLLVDCRVTPDSSILQRLYALPVTLIGAPARRDAAAKILPHPFSIPASPLSFSQRGNVMVGLETGAQLNELVAAYNAAQLPARNVRLFLETGEEAAGNKHLQHLGIFFYSQWRHFNVRGLFHASLFCRRHYGAEFYLSLAAGTPAICVGRTPRGLTADQGVFRTKNLEDAMSLLKMLTGDAAAWRQASARALHFARQEHKNFAALFNSMFPLP